MGYCRYLNENIRGKWCVTCSLSPALDIISIKWFPSPIPSSSFIQNRNSVQCLITRRMCVVIVEMCSLVHVWYLVRAKLPRSRLLCKTRVHRPGALRIISSGLWRHICYIARERICCALVFPLKSNRSLLNIVNIPSQIFYKDALAALLVYDCTCPESFDAIAKWKGEIDEKVSLPNGDPLPVYLLANKVWMPVSAMPQFLLIERWLRESERVQLWSLKHMS